MGVHERYSTSNVRSSANRPTRPHILRLNVKTLPDQTYNDTAAMNIGRQSSLFSSPFDAFLMRLALGDPEEKPKPANTVTSNTRTSSRRPSTTSRTSRPTNTGGAGGKTKTKTGAIVGGKLDSFSVYWMPC